MVQDRNKAKRLSSANLSKNKIQCQNLKLAAITTVYKKNDPLDKTNYRPVSILPVVTNFFARIMQKQINYFIISFLSSYLCGYRKGFNTQHALLTLVDKWRKSLDNKGFGGAILMDLSKASATVNHDLLIAKPMHMVFNMTL